MNNTRKNDHYADGFANRQERYKQYDIIDSIIIENVKSGKYVENAFMLDRLDSENKHMFIICSNYFPGRIAFTSVCEFEKWING